MTRQLKRQRFGEEGVMSREEASRFLGCSTRTLDRRIDERRIDARKDGRLVLICRRSIQEYLDNLPAPHEV